MWLYRGVCPQRALLALAAGGAGRAGVLAEVVVAVDGVAAEVAHEGAAAARHSVAALRLDEPRRTLMALPDAGRRHPLLTAAWDVNTSTGEFIQHREHERLCK